MQEGKLCVQCASVNLHDSFYGPRQPGIENFDIEDYKINILDKIYENEHCPLCRLVSHAIQKARHGRLNKRLDDITSDPGLVTCYLVPWRADCIDGYEVATADAGDKIASALCICLKSRSLQLGFGNEEDVPFPTLPILKLCGGSINARVPRTLLNARVPLARRRSLSEMRVLLEHCKRKHTECRDLTTTRASGSPFYVIDVRSRCLLELPIENCRYAALSYVWGSTTSVQLKRTLMHGFRPGNRIPQQLPNTITDALSICGELRVDYLWADMLCVNQLNSKDKRVQVLAMDEIYRKAEVVLVSLATQQADERMLQQPKEWKKHFAQRMEVVNGFQITTCLPSMSQEMAQSVWRGRGWTLQEGLLARRCILIGAAEAAFVCGKYLKRQSDDWSTDINHEYSTKAISSFDHLLPTNTGYMRGSSWSFTNYDHILRDFSTRHLTKSHDKIDAISGCLSLFTRVQGMTFIHGIPAKQIHFGLLWDDRYRDRRRTLFPSWTWAGWQGDRFGLWFYPSDGYSASIPSTPNPPRECFIVNGKKVLSTILRPAKIRTPSANERKLLVDSATVRLSVSLHTSQNANSAVQAYSERGKPKCVSPEDLSEMKPSKLVDGLEQRLCFRDAAGNDWQRLTEQDHEFHDGFKLYLPDLVTAGSACEILEKGLLLASIMEIKTELDSTEQYFVIFLAVRPKGWGYERFGSGYVPKDSWDAAKPEPQEIRIL